MPADCDQETHRQIHTDHATAVTIGRILVRCGLTARYEPGERCRAGCGGCRGAKRQQLRPASCRIFDRQTTLVASRHPLLPTPSFLPSFLPSRSFFYQFHSHTGRPPPLRRSTPASRGAAYQPRGPLARQPSPEPRPALPR